jgi:hypothetical protein
MKPTLFDLILAITVCGTAIFAVAVFFCAPFALLWRLFFGA